MQNAFKKNFEFYFCAEGENYYAITAKTAKNDFEKVNHILRKFKESIGWFKKNFNV